MRGDANERQEMQAKSSVKESAVSLIGETGIGCQRDDEEPTGCPYEQDCEVRPCHSQERRHRSLERMACRRASTEIRQCWEHWPSGELTERYCPSHLFRAIWFLLPDQFHSLGCPPLALLRARLVRSRSRIAAQALSPAHPGRRGRQLLFRPGSHTDLHLDRAGNSRPHLGAEFMEVLSTQSLLPKSSSQQCTVCAPLLDHLCAKRLVGRHDNSGPVKASIVFGQNRREVQRSEYRRLRAQKGERTEGVVISSCV